MPHRTNSRVALGIPLQLRNELLRHSYAFVFSASTLQIATPTGSRTPGSAAILAASSVILGPANSQTHCAPGLAGAHRGSAPASAAHQFCCASTACGSGQGGVCVGRQAKLSGEFDVVIVSSV
jgi:hypothetical protein